MEYTSVLCTIHYIFTVRYFILKNKRGTSGPLFQINQAFQYLLHFHKPLKVSRVRIVNERFVYILNHYIP